MDRVAKIWDKKTGNAASWQIFPFGIENEKKRWKRRETVPKLQLPSGRKTISRFQTTVVKDEERSKRNRIRRTMRRQLHEESKDDASYLNLKSEGAKRDVLLPAWRGPIEVSCDAL